MYTIKSGERCYNVRARSCGRQSIAAVRHVTSRPGTCHRRRQPNGRGAAVATGVRPPWSWTRRERGGGVRHRSAATSTFRDHVDAAWHSWRNPTNQRRLHPAALVPPVPHVPCAFTAMIVSYKNTHRRCDRFLLNDIRRKTRGLFLCRYFNYTDRHIMTHSRPYRFYWLLYSTQL